MPKASITLYGRDYSVNCDEGQEDRLASIVKIVEAKMKDVTGRVGNTTETRLLMLTCLTLADLLLDLQRDSQTTKTEDEALFVAAVEHLRDRVSHIAAQIGTA